MPLNKPILLISGYFLFCACLSQAQSGIPVPQEIPVTIKLINHKKEPVAFASVTILNRQDSVQPFKKVADKNGEAVFNLIKGNHYSVIITAINYQTIEKGIVPSGGQSLFSFAAEPLGKTLEAAVVTSQKPLMKQEDDKLIVDPENLVAASTSGYEVIEKTPGLFVDQDGNIYISSLTPATVQINGRDMKMSAADVATMLKSLPPNAISKIEILKTPSAKYDASSTGGIVNVVLKKGVKIGLTGSVNGGMQQGTYGNQLLGFNLNNNDGKKSSFITLNFSRRDSYEKIFTDRFFAPDSVLGQAAYTKYPGDTYFASYGIVFPASRKWDIDFGTSASLNDFNNNTNNRIVIKKISNSETITDNMNLVNNDGSSLYFRSGIEGKLTIDTLGSEWENDLFYSYSRNKSEQAFGTYATSPFQLLTSGDGVSDNKRNYVNAKSDLKLKLKKKLTIETGVRSAFQVYRSVTDYYKESGGNREKDPRRTNTFNYNENINAFYFQAAKTLGKDFVIKAGARLENTNMKGRQVIPDDTTFSIHRTDLFPYVYLSKNLMKIFNYELRAYLVYRRTLSRPGYDQLNPFQRYVDEFLTETGNPSLRPQFTQNFEANVSVDERPILAIGINDTKDIFTNVVYQSDTSQRQAFRTYDNLGRNREWYFRGLGAIPPGGRYFFVLGGQYNHNFYQGLYENKPLSFKKGTWTFFTYQTFKIDKRSVITLNGFVRLKGQQQFYELSSFGALNTSVNRKFFKEKLVVTLSLSDLFATNKNDFTIQQGTVEASGFRQSDSRRFGINLRYNFGIRKKEENNSIPDTEPPVTN